eukprot:176032-Chlamydomonas_euryale.AAC.2
MPAHVPSLRLMCVTSTPAARRVCVCMERAGSVERGGGWARFEDTAAQVAAAWVAEGGGRRGDGRVAAAWVAGRGGPCGEGKPYRQRVGAGGEREHILLCGGCVTAQAAAPERRVELHVAGRMACWRHSKKMSMCECEGGGGWPPCRSFALPFRP